MTAVFMPLTASHQVVVPIHVIALNRAKVALMLRPETVFLNSVLFNLPHIWDENIPTACTNGLEIRFSPEFFMSLSQDERIFLMLHEALHVAFVHMDRLGERDQKLWNIAADHVINLMLQEQGFTMPSGGLADPQYRGMSADQVYKLLQQDKQNGAPDPAPGFSSDLEACPKDSDTLKSQVQDILVRAAIRAKQENNKPGSIPGQLQVFLDKLLNPKLPWDRILHKYLHALAKNDYTFRKPNRRFFPEFILPSLYSTTLMDIAVAVDTSGSVTDGEFTRFVTEINSIFRMFKPNKITLIQFDTGIKSTHEVKSLHALSLIKFHGRGGTHIEPVLEWANEHKPQLLLVFTDGEFHWNDIKTRSPVIWLIHNNPNFTAEFGKVITYEVHA